MIKGDDRRVFCIGVDVEDEEEIRKPLKFVAELPKSDDDDICEFEVPTKVSADIVDSSRNINLSSNITYDDVTHDTSGVTRDDQCDINIRVVIPLCTTSRQTHDTVTLTLVDAELGETCTFADFETKEKGDELSDERSTRVTLKPCDNTEQSALPRSIRLRLLHRSDQLRPHRGFAASRLPHAVDRHRAGLHCGSQFNARRFSGSFSLDSHPGNKCNL